MSIQRKKLDAITEKLVGLIFQRFLLTEKMGRIKKKLRIPIDDKYRENEIYKNVETLVDRRNRKIGRNIVKKSSVKKIMKILIEDAKKLMKSRYV